VSLQNENVWFEQSRNVRFHGWPRGRTSNRNLAARLEQKILSRVRQRYADFGPTLAAEHLAGGGIAGEPRDAAELDGEGQLVASPGAIMCGGSDEPVSESWSCRIAPHRFYVLNCWVMEKKRRGLEIRAEEKS
jgi:hypothetical protein